MKMIATSLIEDDDYGIFIHYPVDVWPILKEKIEKKTKSIYWMSDFTLGDINEIMCHVMSELNSISFAFYDKAEISLLTKNAIEKCVCEWIEDYLDRIV